MLSFHDGRLTAEPVLFGCGSGSGPDHRSDDARRRIPGLGRVRAPASECRNSLHFDLNGRQVSVCTWYLVRRDVKYVVQRVNYSPGLVK